LAAAAKKKGPPKKGQKEEEEPVNDSLPSILRPVEPRQLDIFNPKDYVELLKIHIPRPFIFGPVDFEDLQENHNPFIPEFWHEHIL
jgi:hypothetical protein